MINLYDFLNEKERSFLPGTCIVKAENIKRRQQ